MPFRGIYRRLTSIPDDRGQRIPLRRASRAQSEHFASASARWLGAIAIAFSMVGLAAIIALAAVHHINMGQTFGLPDITMRGYAILATIPLYLCGAALACLALNRWTTSLQLAKMRGMHLCSGCGYALRDLPRATDGLTICPECACAWRLPPQCRRPDVPWPIPLSPRPGWITRIRLAASFPDAAGQRWSIFLPAAEHYKRLNRRRRAKHNLVWTAGVLAVFLGPILAVFAALIAAELLLGESAADPSERTLTMIALNTLLLGFAGAALAVLLINKAHRPGYVRQLLALNVCPVCGSELDSLPENTRTTCRACGAVW